jgi:seryl-tRNA synthetase
VYEYGCNDPITGQEAMVEEMFLRNKFWNELVEIDRAFRLKTKPLVTLPEDPTIVLREEKNILSEQIKERRKKSRSGQVDCSDLQEQINGLNHQLKELSPAIKEQRRELINANRPLLNEMDAERMSQVKQAQSASGLYWCNYDDVEKSYDAARKKAMKRV